jgi:signal peptidase II
MFVCIATAVILFDQWTKWIVYSRFTWGQSLVVIKNFFAITYVQNKGAAFGLLHRAPEYFRDPFFIIVPVAALAVIILLFVRLDERQKLAGIALSLITGGAIGNLIDRLRFGYVVDFLDFHWKEIYHWPAFNVADSCIVVGVGIMLIQSFTETKESSPSIWEKKK